MSLSFKNVGVRQDSQLVDPVETNVSKIPYGIKTPIELSHGAGDIFVMHTNIQDQIKDNLKNLILTNHGERLAQYNFGGNLRPLCSEYVNKEHFDTEAMISIKTAIKNNMPFVVPQEFNSEVLNDDKPPGMAKIKLSIVYSVPSLRVLKDQIDIILVVM